MKPSRYDIRALIRPDDVVVHIGHFSRYLERRCARLITIDPRPGITGGYITEFGTVEPVSGIPTINLDEVVRQHRPSVIVRGSKIERL